MERAAYVAPQRSNPAWIAALKTGSHVALGCAVSSMSTLTAEFSSAMGFDYVLIDAQHSPVNPETLSSLLTAVHAGGAKAFVRVGSCYDRMGIQQSLDQGADGILFPCAQTVEDVKHAVSCAKYPMAGPGSVGGTRSVTGNTRPMFPGGLENVFPYLMENGNKESMLAFQIETAGALACVEDICKVPGVDIAFVGPADLATDMGLLTKHGPKAWASEEYINAEKRVMAACAANNVVGGYWLLGDLKSKSDLGYRFFISGGDMHTMHPALKAALDEKRKEAADAGFGSNIKSQVSVVANELLVPDANIDLDSKSVKVGCWPSCVAAQ
jgi:2-keto-3-deoxy-L-rhamnonate aldolase RhmA